MRADELRFLLDFDAWATERVLAAVDGVGGDAFAAAAGPGQVAPRTTLLHCVDVMRTWRERLLGAPETPPPAEGEAATVAELRALWRAEHARLRAYVAGLRESDLGEVLEQRGPDRVVRPERWQLLLHVVLHTMQHRSELAQALTLLGHSPGELGLTAFLPQRLGGDQTAP